MTKDEDPRLKHPCPQCGAKSGEPCHLLKGYAVGTLHKKRKLDKGKGLSREAPILRRRRSPRQRPE